MMRRLAAAILLAVLLAACGGTEPDANVALEEPSAAPTAPAPSPEPTDAAPPAAPPTEATADAPATELPEDPPVDEPAATEDSAPDGELETFELSLSGDGTDGGCTWGVDADEFFYDIVYPEGYEVVGSPATVVGPDGAIVASEGEGMRVTGRLAPDRQPSCDTGTVLVAETVEPL